MADELKTLRQRRVYVIGRLARIKEVMQSLSAEKKEVNDRLKDKSLDSSELKSLRQRKVYISRRPSELKMELATLSSELKTLKGKIKDVPK